MHKQITDGFLDGFTGHSVKEGETVEIISRGLATSDSPNFFVYAEQIASIIFPKLDASTDSVDRYLMVLHGDATADVYLQDFEVQTHVRVNRPMKAGEVVRRNDLSVIEDVQFPGVPIVKGDRVVYFDRRGWRFGIAFDFTRDTDLTGIGVLCAELQRRLLLEDILQVTLAELRNAEESQFDAFIITEGKNGLASLGSRPTRNRL